MRIDAQHAFAPPAQGPEWYAKILERNRFGGSVYLPRDGSVSDALALAEKFPLIRRIVPTAEPETVGCIPRHPLISSVRMETVTPAALRELGFRNWTLEVPARMWPLETGAVPVALDGFPANSDLPSHVYIKMTGFRLPATAEQATLLRRFLRQSGPERLMFASGWPYGGGTWKETLAAFTQALGPMPISVREQLIGGTACDFYGI